MRRLRTNSQALWQHATNTFEGVVRQFETALSTLSNALTMLMDNRGPGFGTSSITISTSGFVPGIDRLRRVGCRLAISLHASNDALRNELVPINKTFNIAELMAACVRMSDWRQTTVVASVGRRITFDVMLNNVNDSVNDARALVALLQASSIECVVNLIPFNAWPNVPFTCSGRNTIMRFADEIRTYGRWPVTIGIAANQMMSTQLNET